MVQDLMDTFLTQKLSAERGSPALGNRLVEFIVTGVIREDDFPSSHFDYPFEYRMVGASEELIGTIEQLRRVGVLGELKLSYWDSL
jgi:hypothetical protein